MNVHLYRSMNNTGMVILAAGRASRFGNIKQLLPVNGKTLLQHVIDEAVAAGAAPIIVVTGANAEKVSAAINNHQVEIVFNAQWAQGKGTSIVAGVEKIIMSNKEIQHIIIAVCDQPFLTASLFVRLYQMQQDSQKNIVASAYADTLGIPVLFTRQCFDHLLSLKKEEGAKKLLMAYSEDVAKVAFPRGHIDIDTQEDYENFLRALPDVI